LRIWPLLLNVEEEKHKSGKELKVTSDASYRTRLLRSPVFPTRNAFSH
jgi:hypothetical protein